MRLGNERKMEFFFALRSAFTIFAKRSRIICISYINVHLTTRGMFGLGTQEILIIALIVLLLFGGKKIPELMKGLGKGVKSFKDGMNSLENEDESKPSESDAKKE